MAERGVVYGDGRRVGGGSGKKGDGMMEDAMISLSPRVCPSPDPHPPSPSDEFNIPRERENRSPAPAPARACGFAPIHHHHFSPFIPIYSFPAQSRFAHQLHSTDTDPSSPRLTSSPACAP